MVRNSFKSFACDFLDIAIRIFHERDNADDNCLHVCLAQLLNVYFITHVPYRLQT